MQMNGPEMSVGLIVSAQVMRKRAGLQTSLYYTRSVIVVRRYCTGSGPLSIMCLGDAGTDKRHAVIVGNFLVARVPLNKMTSV